MGMSNSSSEGRRPGDGAPTDGAVLVAQAMSAEGTFALSTTRVTTIGRDPANIVRPASDNVSRFHAEIRHRDGRWRVRDLESRNGTFVDGERIAECPLGHGQVVTFADAAFRFQGSGPAPGARLRSLPVMSAAAALAAVGVGAAVWMSLDGEQPRRGTSATPAGPAASAPAATATPKATAKAPTATPTAKPTAPATDGRPQAPIGLDAARIEAVHAALAETGHYTGVLDGIWRPGSARAFQAFLASVNRPAVGRITTADVDLLLRRAARLQALRQAEAASRAGPRQRRRDDAAASEAQRRAQDKADMEADARRMAKELYQRRKAREAAGE